MRRLAAVVLLLLVPTQLGCGDRCGNVDCADPETLYVELPDAAPTGAIVQVCFEAVCGTAGMANPTTGSVPWSDIGTWSDHKDEPVEVSVVLDGADISRESAVPDKANSCCGDYWTVRPS